MVLFFVAVFIFGTIVGSFLNVVILRHNTGESSLRGKSMCFSCGKKLKWHELIPIVSFIIQKRKCGKCGSRISWQYPIVEILTGVMFLLIFNFKFLILNEFLILNFIKLFYYWLIFSILIIIAVYDLRHQIIPDKFVYAFDILAFLNLIHASSFPSLALLGGAGKFQVSSFLAGFLFFAFLGLIWLISKGKWMGLGDAKLALGIGWFLGLNKGIWAMLFSFWFGAAVSILLVLLSARRYNLKSSIAFGPFLVLGAAISFFVNNFNLMRAFI